MIHKRAPLSLLAAAVAASVVVPAAAAAPGAVAAPAAGTTVTLLTGDKVVVGGMYGARVLPAKGREHIAFQVRRDTDGDTHVVPSDAVPLLARGKLDPRLFDVTELVRAGYDDASRKMLPLIVDYAGATPRAAGARVSRELHTMGASAVSVDRSAAYWPTARRADKVWLDGPVKANLDHSVPRIGAPDAWAAGHAGDGATVAVLDTGIDVTHPDLSDAVVGARNFTDSDTEDDRLGHGTHVASIITGAGDPHRGVAPDAKLLNGKVLGDFGGGQESWIIAGMEWAAGSGADVVNMSLGSFFGSDGTDPMSQAVNRITAETGTLFVISSGNSGPGEGSVGSPGAADAALTVGAVDREDQLADFSSRGPRLGDNGLKPDITAPGVDIVAAKAKNGVIGDPAADGYVSMSGTSMAAPHVAGAAAILAAQHPDWAADQLKGTLMGSAAPNDALTVFEQGAGRVDVAAATTATVFAHPASIDNGIAQWPHDDDQPITKTVTYTNSGTEPRTLDLAADVDGPGSAAPQGMFTIEPARLTVPAGGQASATVTTDTRVAAADGRYTGVVTATGDGQEVRTPIAVEREVESYSVTVDVFGFDGAPTDTYLLSFVGLDQQVAVAPWEEDGTVAARLPKGRYSLSASVYTPRDAQDFRFADILEPAFVVDGDTSFTVDAREAKPVGFTVDEPTATSALSVIAASNRTAWGESTSSLHLSSLDDYFVRPSTTSDDGFGISFDTHLAKPNGPYYNDSPYLYHLRHSETGRVPENLRWRVKDHALATVRTSYAQGTPGLLGLREGMFAMALPATVTEYYTPGVPWENVFYEVVDLEILQIASDSFQLDPKVYRAGRTTERWNVGVRGPAMPRNPYGAHHTAGRTGDELAVELPLLADQDPGRIGYPAGGGSLTLLRDGEVVDEQPSASYGVFDVGPGQAVYTLRANHERTGARLSTQVSAEWTFTSGHTAEPTALPLLAVRFAPDLDDRNAAPAGKRFAIPVYVQRNGSGVAGVGAPAVEVSYDDGRTWRKAKVSRDHGRWRATVDHPAGAEFVSLRSSVSDRDGNAQRQTVIRAYALK
ncbi:S8 family serine peptidase [Actinophytocola algeriensis]|uniref:Subtilisin family serine protease n=1 Tax=Actinophytocola algeriensis TaxID=1768010 RepID=A0A7W7PZ76_9PSEU|nr:S8 family serine peptidase [Actinophytocola algeriensis]MBB4903964.1 subtilisin family serine protease [Actinophytocola algeriensis]MBE1477179.1 subtilisin family serine protease [Actinophytocola algeriensis]